MIACINWQESKKLLGVLANAVRCPFFFLGNNRLVFGFLAMMNGIDWGYYVLITVGLFSNKGREILICFRFLAILRAD